MEDFRRALVTGPVVYKIVHAVEKIQLSINSEKAMFSVSIQSIFFLLQVQINAQHCKMKGIGG